MRVVFGDCELDSGRRVLLRHGRLIPLSPKGFQLLELLLDRRPEAIPKEDLLQNLWGETFVSDASLHNLVAEIRAAIGDNPQAARYIRTIPRYGYAFHGEARPAPADVSGGRASGPRLVAEGREWLLTEGSNLLGRDRDCVVRIDSATLSRHHARIVLQGVDAILEDLASKNGTHVNAQRVTQPVALKDGDYIQVGSVGMTYRALDLPLSTITGRP